MSDQRNKIMNNTIKAMVLIVIAIVIALAGSTRASCAADLQHKDFGGYCVRYYDVSLTTSEIQDLTEGEIEALICENAHFKFRLYGGTWAPVTSGYTVDYSGFSPTAGTHIITVRFPTLTQDHPTPSFNFNVTVANDMAPVRYGFTSGTSGVDIPSALLSLLPSDTTVKINGTAYPSKGFTTYRYSNGTWTFEGWDADEKQVIEGGVTFTGTWTFKADPVKPVPDHPSVKPPKIPASATATKTPVASATENTETATLDAATAPSVKSSTPVTASTASSSDDSALRAVLAGGIGTSSVALAMLILSIFSDVKVLRWYCRKLIENRR